MKIVATIDLSKIKHPKVLAPIWAGVVEQALSPLVQEGSNITLIVEEVED